MSFFFKSNNNKNASKIVDDEDYQRQVPQLDNKNEDNKHSETEPVTSKLLSDVKNSPGAEYQGYSNYMSINSGTEEAGSQAYVYNNEYMSMLVDNDDNLPSEQNVSSQSTDQLIDQNGYNPIGSALAQQRRKNNLKFDIYIRCYFISWIFSPLICLYWYSSWQFLDIYFFPNRIVFSNFLCWSIGLLILLPSYLFQEHLQTSYNYLGELGRCGSFLRFLMRVVYVYLTTLAVIFEWRGLWNIIGLYFFDDLASQLCLSIICVAYLCLTRSTRTLLSNPYMLFMDDIEWFFTNDSSRFKLNNVSAYVQYSIDYLMTEIIECFALVAVWRGIENSFDAYVYPNNPQFSIVFSFITSHIIYLIIISIQRHVYELCSRLSLVIRLAIEDIIFVVMFCSAVLAWNSCWDLYDYYLQKFNLDPYFFWIACHAGSFIVAVLLKISTLLAGPGTSFLDGDRESESNLRVYFDINFFTTLFERHNEQNETEAIRQNSIY